MGKNITCLVLPAFGHLLPMVHLAKRLARSHHNVTFATSSGALKGLRSRGLFDDEHSVRLFGIQDGVDDEFDLSKPSENLAKNFGMILAGVQKFTEDMCAKSLPPTDVMITDITIGPSLETISRSEIPFYLLNCGRAYHTALMVLLMDENSAVKPYTNAVSDFLEMPGPDGKLHGPQPDGLFQNFFMQAKRALPTAHGVLVNSIREFEESTIAKIKEQPGMREVPVYCFGPLLQEDPGVSASKTNKSNSDQTPITDKLIPWLDRKAPDSVVYVAFGTLLFMKPEQVKELGDALCQLKRPVIWSLKAKEYEHLSEPVRRNIDDPDGDLRVVAWAPQKVVLGHPNVGVFFSHCGWSSTMEGLSAGLPFLAWPQRSDQLMNATFVENQGAGIVIRLQTDELITSAKLLKMLARISETGSAYSVKAKVLRDQLHMASQKSGSAYTDYFNLLESLQQLPVMK